jgi:hypothetical protein
MFSLMMILLGAKNRIEIIQLSPEEERKYDLTHNKVSFKIGEINPFAVIIIIVAALFVIFPGYFLNFNLLTICLYIIYNTLFLVIVFISYTRKTELDRAISNAFWECIFDTVFSYFMCLWFPYSDPFSVVVFLLGVVSAAVGCFYAIYTWILVIQKLFLYFFATEEQKNQWKEEFIKENRPQPTEKSAPPTENKV